MAFGSSVAASAKVVLGIDDRELTAGLDRDERKVRESAGSMEHSLGRVERGVLAGSGAFSHLGRSVAFASTAFLGAAGFTQIAKDSVTAAEDLNAQVDRTGVVFGSSAKAVLAWSRGAAGSIGLARDEALKAADTFGAMQRAVGLVGPQAAQTSDKLASLAANLAEIHHVPVDQVFSALEAGLRGRGQQLTEFGIKLSSAALAEEAYRQGLVKSTVDQAKVSEATTQVAIAEAKLADARKRYGAGTTQVASAEITLAKAQAAAEKAAAGTTAKLTDQQKTLAALAVIFRQTGDQAGYLADHQDNLTFQSHKLHAELRDGEATIGRALLPTITSFVTKLSDWIDKAQRTGQLQRDVNTAMRVAKQVIGDVTAAVVPFAKGANEVAHALGGWKTTLEGVLALGVAAKVAGMAAAFDGLAASEGAAATGALGLLSNLKALRLVELPAAVLSVGARGETGTKTLKGWSYLGGRWYQTDAPARVSDLPAGASYVDLHGHGGVTGGAAAAASPFVGAATSVAGGRGVQLPTSQTPTHETAGLAGFPAVDIMAKPGTPIGAPEDGIITRISGHEPTEAPPQGQGGPWGLSIYYLGSQTGNTYYMTHLVKVAPPGRYRRGDVIGLIGDYPGSSADHVHFAIHQGDSPEAHYGSSLFNPADYLARPQGGGAAPVSSPATAAVAAAAAAGMPPPAGGSLRVGKAAGTPPPRPAVPVISAALENAYLAAQIAGDQEAQLRILEQERAALEAERKHPKFGQTVGDILNALLGVDQSIAQWHQDRATELAAEDKEIRQRNATTMANNRKVISAAAAAWARIFKQQDAAASGVEASAQSTISGLNQLGKNAVIAGARAELLAFQKASRGPIAPGFGATATAVARATGVPLPQPGFDTPAPTIDAQGHIVATPRTPVVDQQAVADAIKRRDIAQAKLDEVLKKYGAGTTQVAEAQIAVDQAEKGVTKAQAGTVPSAAPPKLTPAWGTFKQENLPVLGKLLIPLALMPQIQKWEAFLRKLKLELKAALQRLAVFKRDLKAAKAMTFPNPKLVEAIQAKIAAANKTIANLKRDIATCVARLKDLGQVASSAVQEAAQEAEDAAAQAAEQAAQTDATDTGSDLTVGGGDSGGGGGGGDTGTSAADAAAQAAAAAAEQQRQAVAQADSFLAGIYAIRPFQSNLLPEPGRSPFGGAHITINQYYKGPPEDPHSYSQALAFELAALAA